MRRASDMAENAAEEAGKQEQQVGARGARQRGMMRRITYGVAALTVVVLLIASPLFLGIAQEKRQKADERGIDCQRASILYTCMMA